MPCGVFSSLSSVMLRCALYCILYYVKASLSTFFLECELQSCSKNPCWGSIFDKFWVILALLGGSGRVLGASWGPLGRSGRQNPKRSIILSSFGEPKCNQNREKSFKKCYLISGMFFGCFFYDFDHIWGSENHHFLYIPPRGDFWRGYVFWLFFEWKSTHFSISDFIVKNDFANTYAIKHFHFLSKTKKSRPSIRIVKTDVLLRFSCFIFLPTLI